MNMLKINVMHIIELEEIFAHISHLVISIPIFNIFSPNVLTSGAPKEAEGSKPHRQTIFS